jgi:hypothetical protein
MGSAPKIMVLVLPVCRRRRICGRLIVSKVLPRPRGRRVSIKEVRVLPCRLEETLTQMC